MLLMINTVTTWKRAKSIRYWYIHSVFFFQEDSVLLHWKIYLSCFFSSFCNLVCCISCSKNPIQIRCLVSSLRCAIFSGYKEFKWQQYILSNFWKHIFSFNLHANSISVEVSKWEGIYRINHFGLRSRHPASLLMEWK